MDLGKLVQTVASTEQVAVQAIAARYLQCLKVGGTLYFAGNGGSAADAQHIATEYVGRFQKNRKPYKALALTTDSSLLTALSNDLGFETVFARQVEAFCTPNDVLTLHSTSGESENLLHAAYQAHDLGVCLVALTGKGGGKLATLCDYGIVVPSTNTARIQEVHLALQHAICDLVEGHLHP